MNQLYAVYAAFAARAGAQDCTPLRQLLQQLPGRKVFSTVLQASDVELNSTETYTVFVPPDGSEEDDTSMLGLFTSYGVNTSTVASVRANEFLDSVQGAGQPCHVPTHPRCGVATSAWEHGALKASIAHVNATR